MVDRTDASLLSAIEAIYQAALSPAEYESFAHEWDTYVADIQPGSDDADRLLAHVDRAMTILDRLHPAAREVFEPAEMVERETGPAAIIDGAGEIVVRNKSWQMAIGTAGGHVWDLADDPAEADRLRAAVHGLHEIAESRTGYARLSDTDRGQIASVAIRRLTPGEIGGAGPLYLVRTTHAPWSDRVGDVLTSEFGLTAAELQLLKRMAQGDSFADIATETGRAPDTLKSQSKSIYRKMQATGREDVVRIALQLHLLLQGAAPQRQAVEAGPDHGVLRLGDARTLGWTRRGSTDGTPFLFLHGMSLGHGMTGDLVDALKTHDLAAICIDRPGYGRSDPPRDWRCSVEEWVELIPELLDHFEIERARIVTHTSGVLYGCAAAAHHPGRVSGVMALAGGVPITDPGMLGDYPSQVRLLSRTARLSPRALRFVLSTSAAFYRSEAGRNRLIQRTYGQTPSDRTGLDDPEILGLIHDGLGLIETGGHDGFVGDGLHIFGDWSDVVKEMQGPLTYVLGEEDPICPLGWAEAFAQRYPHVSVEAVPRAGQLLHHTHAEAIARQIADFVGGQSVD